MGIKVPAGYSSPDVIDRTGGQKPTLADRVRDLIVKVRDDYNESLGASKMGGLQVGINDASGGLDDEAVTRIHAKLKTMFVGGSQ